MKHFIILTIAMLLHVSAFAQIDPKKYDKSATEVVEFAKFPRTLAEFKAEQARLGNSIGGAVALTLMAYQMYYNDQTVGTEALKLINYSGNMYSTLSVLKQKYRKSLAGKDSYCQPWLVASYLEGATPANAYRPSKPYRIHVRTNPARKYETLNSSTFRGWIYPVQVKCNGADTAWRGVDVCKEKGKQYYTIFNCPNLYVGVKEIDLECDDDYVDIK